LHIHNTSKNTSLATRAEIAQTTRSRAIGLLNRSSLGEGEALVIKPCRSIHMFCMRFAIDAVFVSKDHRVVGLLNGIKPNRLSPIYWKANYVIELPEGVVSKSLTEVGDEIELS